MASNEVSKGLRQLKYYRRLVLSIYNDGTDKHQRIATPADANNLLSKKISLLMTRMGLTFALRLPELIISLSNVEDVTIILAVEKFCPARISRETSYVPKCYDCSLPIFN